MAVGEQQQKEGAARRQRGTRGTRVSFGGAMAKLALVTPAYIGALHLPSHPNFNRHCHVFSLWGITISPLPKSPSDLALVPHALTSSSCWR